MATLRNLAVSALLVLPLGCSSPGPDASAPVDPITTVGGDTSTISPTEAPAGLPSETAAPKPEPGILEEVPASESLGNLGEKAGDLAANPAYEQLRKQLSKLGYEGMGLEHETTEAVTLLTSVFQSPEVQRLKIKRVYTGASMEYDAKAQAVTIGGLKTKDKILNYFKKNIPRR